MNKWLNRLSASVGLPVCCGVAGCGFQVPTIEPLASSQLEVSNIFTGIADHIGCELGTAVVMVHSRYHTGGFAQELAWLDSWVAKVTPKFVVQEKTILAPNIGLSLP